MKVTAGDILAAIDALGKEQPKHPSGDGWRTIKQMAKTQGVTVSTMRYRFARALEKGLQIERFVGSDYDPTGRLVKQTWFRVKK